MFSCKISMFWADGECWGDGYIRELILGNHFFDEHFACLSIRYTFAHIEMQYGTACIFALQFILVFQCLEGIISKFNWKLSRICIIGVLSCSRLSNIRELFLILFSRSIGCTFSWSCLKIIHIPCFFLVFFEDSSHFIENFESKFLSPIGRYIFFPVREIQDCLIHSIDTNRGKMIAK